VLLDHGINATVRESRGRDIAAACGQLAIESGSPRPRRHRPTLDEHPTPA
jgi:adenine C2-methylase RlmN of 23S rRNA A2503 and tRNA A37